MPPNPPHLPKGPPGRCPVCDSEIPVEASWIFGPVTCNSCQNRLWMVRTSKQTRVLQYARAHHLEQRIVDFVSEQLGVERERVHGDWVALSQLGADSLDTLEMVIEIEEELDQLDDQL